jgi:hypothetical protein
MVQRLSADPKKIAFLLSNEACLVSHTPKIEENTQGRVTSQKASDKPATEGKLEVIISPSCRSTKGYEISFQ